MPRIYEIHRTDGGEPDKVDKVTEDNVGVVYTDADGCQVRVPWGQVDRVVSYRADGDDAAEAETPTEAVDAAAPAGPDSDESDGTGEPAGDDKDGKASEWAEADPDVVRTWARENGHVVKDSGPLSKAVLAAYAAAHSG